MCECCGMSFLRDSPTRLCRALLCRRGCRRRYDWERAGRPRLGGARRCARATNRRPARRSTRRSAMSRPSTWVLWPTAERPDQGRRRCLRRDAPLASDATRRTRDHEDTQRSVERTHGRRLSRTASVARGLPAAATSCLAWPGALPCRLTIDAVASGREFGRAGRGTRPEDPRGRCAGAEGGDWSPRDGLDDAAPGAVRCQASTGDKRARGSGARAGGKRPSLPANCRTQRRTSLRPTGPRASRMPQSLSRLHHRATRLPCGSSCDTSSRTPR